MFVAGTPDPGDERPRTMTFWGRMFAGVAPGTLFAPSGLPEGEAVPGAWHLPGEMAMSVDIVRQETDRLHLPLRVIDVNRPGEDEPLLARYVGPEDVLPLVVRSDSGRLEGLDAITPANVRRFLSRH